MIWTIWLQPPKRPCWASSSLLAVLRAKQYKCESLEILEAFFLTLVGATVASVWDDIFHHPDDEAVLDNTLACVRWMYSEWDTVSGWMGFPEGMG